MAEYSSRLLHPRYRLLKIVPKVILERDRFFITKEGHIKNFLRLCIDNYEKVKQRNLIASNIQIFVNFLSQFLERDFVDPIFLFKKVCSQFPFEFLLLFDLCRQ